MVPSTCPTPSFTGSGRILGLLVCAAAFTSLKAEPPAGYALTLADEFSGTSLDSEVWVINPSRPNVSVEGGSLHLTTQSLGGGAWRTGSVSTRTFTQRFGYYEARFRIGAASGLNNAFWLNTPADAVRLNSIDRLEIDIMEAHFPSKLNYNVHDWAPTHTGQGHAINSGLALSADYHTYALEWGHDHTLRFYLNGQLMHSRTSASIVNAESFIPLEVLLSTLVTSFAGSPGAGLDGTRMSIDYVRVYDTPGFTGASSNNWGSETNWASGRYPRAGDAAIFNRPTPHTTITVAGADKAAREIYFDHPDLPALSIQPRSDFPAAVLRLGSSGGAGITLNSRVTTPQTLAIPVVAETPLQLGNFSTAPEAHLRFTQPLRATTAGQALHVLGPGLIHLAGPIESTFATLQVVGGGLLRLSATNAYTGETSLLRGTIEVTADGALGAPSQPTRLTTGTTLALVAGVQYLQAEPLFLAGHGDTGRAGALEVADASSVTWAGPLTVVSSTTLAAPLANSRLRLTAPLETTATADLTTRGEGEIEFREAVHGVRNLIHSGPGTLHLRHDASTFGSNATGTTTGTLRIGAGTVVVGADAPAGAPGALGRSTFRVRLGGAGEAGAGGDAALLVDGPFAVGRALQIDADNLARTIRIGTTGPHLSRFSGPIYLQREVTLAAAAGGTLRVEGAIHDETHSGSLRIEGPGNVELTGANRFTGGTTVTGSLRLAGELVSPVNVLGGSLGGSGRITAPVTIDGSGRLALLLGTTPVAHLPLRIDAALTLLPGASVVLTGETPAPGTSWTLVRSPAASNPLPALELPAGWEGDLAWEGGDLLFSARALPSARATWRELHFGSAATTGPAAPLADPDGDGLPNLLEYALGLAPLFADAAGAVTPGTAAGRLTLQFARVADPELTYSVEAADSPLAQAWTAIWTSTGADNTPGPVTVPDTVPLTAHPTRLLRLRVTVNTW